MDGICGRTISRGSRPQFADVLQQLKNRAVLVNNELGEDLTACFSKERDSANLKDPQGRGAQKWMSERGCQTEPEICSLQCLSQSTWAVEV